MIDVIISLPDQVQQATVIKRKAQVMSLIYDFQNKEIVVSWSISFYSATSEGEYGEPMPNMQHVTYTNRATMNTYVDGNGDAVNDPFDVTPAVYEDEVEISPEVKTLKPGVMPSFTFFNYLAENIPIKLHDLFKKYGIRDAALM